MLNCARNFSLFFFFCKDFRSVLHFVIVFFFLPTSVSSFWKWYEIINEPQVVVNERLLSSIRFSEQNWSVWGRKEGRRRRREGNIKCEWCTEVQSTSTAQYIAVSLFLRLVSQLLCLEFKYSIKKKKQDGAGEPHISTRSFEYRMQSEASQYLMIPFLPFFFFFFFFFLTVLMPTFWNETLQGSVYQQLTSTVATRFNRLCFSMYTKTRMSLSLSLARS